MEFLGVQEEYDKLEKPYLTDRVDPVIIDGFGHILAVPTNWCPGGYSHTMISSAFRIPI